MKPLLYIGLVAMMLLAPMVLAQDATEDAQDATDAGILPSSPFYALDVWWESVQQRTAASDDQRATLALERAKEHLAEAKLMAKDKRDTLAQKALSEHDKALSDLDSVEKSVSEANRERVQEALKKHVERLNIVKAKLEEKGVNVQGITNAIDKSSKVLTKTSIDVEATKAKKAEEESARQSRARNGQNPY